MLMLTKGIILERLATDNKYLVRVPVLETPEDVGESSLVATLSYTSGIVESLKSNDAVIIGFEDHNADNPIIIGKLFTQNDQNEPRGYANLESLNVKNKVTLPEGTTIAGQKLTSQYFDTINSKIAELTDYIPLTGTTQLRGSISPMTNNMYDLGSNTHRFKDGYFANSLSVDKLKIDMDSYNGYLSKYGEGDKPGFSLGYDFCSSTRAIDYPAAIVGLTYQACTGTNAYERVLTISNDNLDGHISLETTVLDLLLTSSDTNYYDYGSYGTCTPGRLYQMGYVNNYFYSGSYKIPSYLPYQDEGTILKLDGCLKIYNSSISNSRSLYSSIYFYNWSSNIYIDNMPVHRGFTYTGTLEGPNARACFMINTYVYETCASITVGNLLDMIETNVLYPASGDCYNFPTVGIRKIDNNTIQLMYGYSDSINIAGTNTSWGVNNLHFIGGWNNW